MLAAEKFERLNRLYAVSSGINEAIVRVEDESRLYLEACRIAVEKGGFEMAWVGLEEPGQKVLKPVARWGCDDGYVDSFRITTHTDTREGLGPGGTALRSGEAAVCNDIEAETQHFAFRREALAHGFRSCAAFPLKKYGTPFAVFFVYATEPMYFDQQELALLTSLAENFSFAIEAREKAQQRSRIESALRVSEAECALSSTTNPSASRSSARTEPCWT
ncbi:MAG: GAF domain-containing protein [Ramlibacter sp.]|nr:GAF domain-containing protein [Ramlibacter sp.]